MRVLRTANAALRLAQSRTGRQPSAVQLAYVAVDTRDRTVRSGWRHAVLSRVIHRAILRREIRLKDFELHLVNLSSFYSCKCMTGNAGPEPKYASLQPKMTSEATQQVASKSDISIISKSSGSSARIRNLPKWRLISSSHRDIRIPDPGSP